MDAQTLVTIVVLVLSLNDTLQSRLMQVLKGILISKFKLRRSE